MENTEYKYNDMTERYKKMNRFYIISTIVIGVVFFMYLFLKLLVSDISRSTVYGNMALMVICTIANTVVFEKHKDTKLLKIFATYEVGIVYLLVGLQTDATFINYGIIAISLLQIPYYDKNGMRKTTIGMAILYIIVTVAQIRKGIIPMDIDHLCGIILVLFIGICILNVGKIIILFNDDAMGATKAEQDSANKLIDKMMETSKVINDDTTKSDELMNELLSSTQNVAGSMKDIKAATNNTAMSIQEQSNMTSLINDAISQTSQASERMVEIANSSNDSVHENMLLMDELKAQSAHIAETNEAVRESMQKLQSRAKEVESIAGMILSISSQTNLLALNASIESARAGDAGRGFAVVADQIRQLADETKKSTEDITKIANELNSNADEVVGSVQSTIEAAGIQRDKIETAGKSFKVLNENMENLIGHVDDVNKHVNGLSESNNKIVGNISQLSAVTEEVTVNAEQIYELSEKNLGFVQQVKQAVNHIKKTSDASEAFIRQ